MVQERPVRVARRLSAILAADVAGYSRLMHNDEEATHAKLTALLADVVMPAIAEYGGRIVKNTGDGFLAEFPSAVEAVRAAVQFQARIHELTTGDAEDRRIAFRVGINIGDIIVEPHDIFGDGVNIAARLEALAEPGGICISRVVRDQTRDKLSYPFEDLGEHSVKNIARPVRVYAMGANAVASTPLVTAQAQPRSLRRSIIPQRALIAAGVLAVIGIAIVAWWAWSRGNSPTVAVQAPALANPQVPSTVASTPAPRLSFVVLPFANLSSDPEQEYFADGITGDLERNRPAGPRGPGRRLAVHDLSAGSNMTVGGW